MADLKAIRQLDLNLLKVFESLYWHQNIADDAALKWFREIIAKATD